MYDMSTAYTGDSCNYFTQQSQTLQRPGSNQLPPDQSYAQNGQFIQPHLQDHHQAHEIFGIQNNDYGLNNGQQPQYQQHGSDGRYQLQQQDYNNGGYNIPHQQQQMSFDPGTGLGASFVGNGGFSDFPDVNSLEATLVPQQLFPPPPPYHHNSPTASSHTSTGSDESDDFYCWHPYKKAMPIAEVEGKGKPRGKASKKRKPKKDPNEPQKPVSAYALFFRDTQAAIKGQNPNASFGEVSKIVASMWDSLDTDAKNAYKLKTETAKKDYLKQLAAYRANLISKNGGGGVGGTVDSYSTQELNGLHHFSFNTQSSPDSTTLQESRKEPAYQPPVFDVGEKSLASLIAEPTPQHVLTATTTLTVPQSYIPVRSKGDMEGEGEDGGPWECGPRDFHPNQGLLQHCRDVFNIWGQPRREENGGSTEFAQV